MEASSRNSTTLTSSPTSILSRVCRRALPTRCISQISVRLCCSWCASGTCADAAHCDTAGHKFSLGLVANAPGVGGGGGFKWQDKSQGGLHRSACDKKGEYKFTPLYELIRPINREKRRTRGKDEPELTGEDLSVLSGFSLCLLRRS